MTDEKLFGFIGELRGNEDRIVGMDAVSRDGEVYYRYPAGEGMARRTLSSDELEYVIAIDTPAPVRWRPGYIIWFAGRNLVARSGSIEPIRNFTADWYATTSGHRLTAGTAADLRRWRDNVAEELSKLFRRCLFERLELHLGDAKPVWEAFAAFDGAPSPRRSINAALYFSEVERDKTLFDFEKERSVLNGAFESEEAFTQEFENTREWLSADRLAEQELARRKARTVRERPEAENVGHDVEHQVRPSSSNNALPSPDHNAEILTWALLKSHRADRRSLWSRFLVQSVDPLGSNYLINKLTLEAVDGAIDGAADILWHATNPRQDAINELTVRGIHFPSLPDSFAGATRWHGRSKPPITIAEVEQHDE